MKEKLLLLQQNQDSTTNMTAVTVTLNEVFTTYTDFSKTKEWSEDELLSHISCSFETYQNELWNLHVDYRVNIFESESARAVASVGTSANTNNNGTPVRISDEDIALEVQKILLSRRQPIEIDYNLIPNIAKKKKSKSNIKERVKI
jgi:hypothetical protein